MRCKWLCLALLTTGCLADEEEACARYSETYELQGEVTLASSAKSVLSGTMSAPIVLEAFEDSTVTYCGDGKVGVGSPGRGVGELVLAGPGKFEWKVRVEGYQVHRSAIAISGFVDANEDGSCTQGELFATAEIQTDGQLKLEFKAGQSCQYRI